MSRLQVPRFDHKLNPVSNFWDGVHFGSFVLMILAVLCLPFLLTRHHPEVEAAQEEAKEIWKANQELMRILARERSRNLALLAELKRQGKR